jgi:hypothetical protein
MLCNVNAKLLIFMHVAQVETYRNQGDIKGRNKNKRFRVKWLNSEPYNYHSSGHINHPVFYLKHNVFQNRFSLNLQVEPTQFGPVDRASLCLVPRRRKLALSIGPNCVGPTRRRRQNRVYEKLCFFKRQDDG